MNRGQKPGRAGSRERPAPGALLVGDEEEVDRERRCEDVQRVHARERPVDEQERRRRDDERGDCSRHRAPEAPPDIPAERQRREREDDGEPAERERRRVEGERDVREDEMERAAAALPHHRLDDLAERPRGDQAADGLVLEERLAVDVVEDARKQDPGAGQQRAHREDEREGLSPRPARRLRPGRPGRGAPVRGGTRATRRRDERVEVDTRFHPLPVQEVDEVLGGDVAGGARRERAAAQPADGGLEDGRARLESRVGRREAGVPRVVEVDARPARASRGLGDEPLHLPRHRDADRVGEDDLVRAELAHAVDDLQHPGRVDGALEGTAEGDADRDATTPRSASTVRPRSGTRPAPGSRRGRREGRAGLIRASASSEWRRTSPRSTRTRRCAPSSIAGQRRDFAWVPVTASAAEKRRGRKLCAQQLQRRLLVRGVRLPLRRRDCGPP